MAELKLTPARVALLRGAKRGELTGYLSMRPVGIEIYWDGIGRGQRVYTRAQELLKAGWIEETWQNPVEMTLSYRLTAAGQKVLEEADRHA